MRLAQSRSEMWDHADKSLIPTIFHPGFTFRGSLGPSLVGYDEFAGYVDWVTGVFGQYTTDILALIEEENRVSGKMRFNGFHRSHFQKYLPPDSNRNRSGNETESGRETRSFLKEAHRQEVFGVPPSGRGGWGCRSSHLTAPRFATSTFLAIFMD